MPLAHGSGPIYDRTDLVNNTLHTVTHTLLEGLVIVLAVYLLGVVGLAALPS